MGRDIDWSAIKTEYVTGSCSQRALSEKHGVSQTALNSRARREGWAESRNSFALRTTQNAEEKAASALAEAEAEVVKAKSSVRLKLWRLIERRVDRITDKTTLSDVRRAVQSYCDMLKSEADAVQNEEVEDSGLIAALTASVDQGLWDDGDDSDFLPNQEGEHWKNYE